MKTGKLENICPDNPYKVTLGREFVASAMKHKRAKKFERKLQDKGKATGKYYKPKSKSALRGATTKVERKKVTDGFNYRKAVTKLFVSHLQDNNLMAKFCRDARIHQDDVWDKLFYSISNAKHISQAYWFFMDEFTENTVKTFWMNQGIFVDSKRIRG